MTAIQDERQVVALERIAAALEELAFELAGMELYLLDLLKVERINVAGLERLGGMDERPHGD